MIRFRRPRHPLGVARRAVAGLLAVTALVLALRPSAPALRAPGTGAGVPVTVAAADLPAGTALDPGRLRVASFPAGLVPAGAAADPAPLRGRVLAAGVRAGEPVTDVRLVGAGLTALLAPGQVAAAVRPSDLAVTGLVRTGDHVDVLAAAEGAERAETVVGGALVLAAPGTRDPPEGAGGANGAAPDGLLLLAVDAPTAARLAAASAAATLTVTLTSG